MFFGTSIIRSLSQYSVHTYPYMGICTNNYIYISWDKKSSYSLPNHMEQRQKSEQSRIYLCMICTPYCLTPTLFGGRIRGTSSEFDRHLLFGSLPAVSEIGRLDFFYSKIMPLRNLENNNVSFAWTYQCLPLCIHSSNSDSPIHVIGQTSSFFPMARFFFFLIASLVFAVGKPEELFPSGPEPGVLAQQLSGTSGAGSLPLSIPDGKVPDSGLQAFDGNAISLQDPSNPESAITENSLNPSSALIASTPKGCSSPASKLRKRQNPVQFIWNGIQELPFMNFLKPPPSEDHSFCPNSPDVLTGGEGSSAPRVVPKPKLGVVDSQPKKVPQERPQDEPEPMTSGPQGPSCPYDHPQKVCCRGDLTAQLLAGFGSFLDQCWDCELLQLTCERTLSKTHMS